MSDREEDVETLALRHSYWSRSAKTASPRSPTPPAPPSPACMPADGSLATVVPGKQRPGNGAGLCARPFHGQ
ncbi:hypothetical protein [Streptomyces sp. 2A115]|uniref:hypothetical protein n=1 Tax=Streptomyces sp. 2A115 TaxID=3457439 RepID=UPI003FD2F11F